MYIPLARFRYDSNGNRLIIGEVHAFPTAQAYARALARNEVIPSACGKWEFSFSNWSWALPDEMSPLCELCERALILEELGE